MKKLLLIYLIVCQITAFAQQQFFIKTIAGTGTGGYTLDGVPATASEINGLNALFVDGSGNIYISDALNSRIRKISTSGIITTVAGNGTAGYTLDGIAATATELNKPSGVIVDDSGNIFISDTYNQRVRKVNTLGIISTIAGNGTAGFFGDGGSALIAEFDNPYGLALDSYHNLYIVDQLNHEVRELNTTTGIISRFAGTGVAGFSGDGGPATAALIDKPNYVMTDASNNVYITDNQNQCIRKVNTLGVISLIAGTPGSIGYGGDGGSALSAIFAYPAGIRLDASGNLYIADFGNQRVRMINSSGIISTIAGNGTGGYNGDGILATAAEIDNPLDVEFTSSGHLIIADYLNNRVRELDTNHAPTFVNGNSQTATVCSDSTLLLNTILTINDSDVGQTERWHLVSGPHNGTVTTGGVSGLTYTATSTGNNITPVSTTAMYYIPTAGFSGVDSFYVRVNDSIASDTTRIVVTVKAAPTAITGTFILCPGATTSLADAVTGGTWSSGNTAVATVGSTGIVTGATSGTADIIYTTSCGSVSTTVTVSAAPAAFYAGIAVDCGTGGARTFTDSTTGGVWSSSNTAVATISSGGAGTIVGAGTSTIIYTIGSCSASSVLTVAAYSPVTPASSSICVGGTVSLVEAGTTGISYGVILGLWSNSDTSVASLSSSNVVTGLSPGIDTIGFVIYDATTSVCGSAVTVTVNAAPTIQSNSSSTGLATSPLSCVGDFIVYSPSTSGGIWSSSNTAVATIGSAGAVTGIMAGTTVITYTEGSCYATSVLTVVASSAISPLTSSICVGSTETLTEASTSGVWTSTNTALATVSSSGLVTALSTGADTISYQAYVGATPVCAAYIAAVNVTSGAGSITPSAGVSFCSGTTYPLADATTGGVWSSSSTGVATVSSSGVVSGVSAGTATIVYTVGSCATSKVVTVTAGPAALSPSTATVCSGTTTILTDAVTGGVWGSSATGVATVASGTVGGAGVGTAIISYTVGSCTTTAAVTVNNAPVAITPSTAVTLCSGGATVTLADATTGGVWSSSSTGLATVSTSGVVSGYSAATVTITYAVGSCYATKAVTIITGVDAISPSSASVCTGTTSTLTDGTTGGAWSSNNTAVASVSGGVVSGIAAGTAIISYTAGTCYATSVVTVAGSPAAITPSTAIVFCSATTTSLAESVTGGAWSSGATGIATVSSAGTVTGVAAGTAIISYSSGSCYATKTVTVSSGPQALLPASPTICTGNTLAVTDAVAGGTWSSASTATATVSSTGTVSGIAAGSAVIMYSIGSCTATDTVTVITSPTAGSISGTTSLCVGSNTTLTDAASGGVWSSSTTAAATVSGGIVYGAGVGTTAISYTISSSCGVIAATHVITVNTSPSAGTITGASSICSGTTTPLSNTVTGGSWMASNSHASVNSATGLITGISAGADTITYTITTPCGTASTTMVITIGAYFSAGAISGGATLCGGTTLSLTDGTTGGVWSSSNSSAAVGSTGIVTGALAGGMDTIIYTITASCGLVMATHIIDVFPAAVSDAISGIPSVCVGSSATFTEITTGGVWSSRNSNATVTGGGLVSGVSAGTDIISYTVSNSCGTAVATVDVTIGGTATAGTISGASSVCIGGPITLTDAVSGGLWSSSNANASVSASGIVSALASGLDTISYTITGSCGTATATFVISATSSSTPTAGSITGVAGVCIGYPIAFTDVIPGGVWSLSNTRATISSSGLVSGVTTGTDTAIYTVTSSCGTATATSVFTTGTASGSAGIITGPAVVCAGSTISLADVSGGGTWSSSNTNAIVSAGAVTGVAAGTAVISYSVTYSCGLTYATDDITINPSSGISAITGADTVCLGSTITLTDATAGGVWSSGNTNVAVSGGVVTGMALGTSPVSYTATSSCGSSSAITTITVVAGATISLAPISGISIVCIGSGITLTDATAGGTWVVSNPNAEVVGPGIIDGISPGVDTVGYLVTNVCGTAEVTKILNVDTIPSVAAISGPGAQCVGATITLTDPTAGGIWTTSTATVGTVDISTGVVTGLSAGTTTITYTVTNLFGCPGTVIITDVVSPPSITTGITGSAGVCAGAAVTLGDATTGGTWSSSNTAIATVDPALGIVTGIAAGTVTIVYTVAGSCGTSFVAQVETVSGIPSVAAISGSPTGCMGSAVTLSDATAGGAWSSSNTAIATVDSTTGAVTGITTGVVTINYTVSSAGCSATAGTSIFINPAPSIDAITGSAIECAGSSTPLADGSGGGAWSSSNTAIATVDGAGNVTGIVPGTVTISYTITGSGCPGIATITDIVSTIPVSSPVTGTPHVCAGAITVLGNAIAGGVWSSGNTGIAIANASTGAITGLSGGTAEIYYAVSNSCGSAIDSALMTVYPGPAIDPITAAYTALCTGDLLDVSDGVAGGTWGITNTAIASVSNAGVVTGLTAGTDTVYYIVTNSSGCSSGTILGITIGGAIASAAVDPTGVVALCNGHTQSMSVTSLGGVTYQWQRNDSAIAGATTTSYVTAATGNYAVIVSNGSCSETVMGPSIMAPATPVIAFIPPDVLYTGTFASYKWYLNGVLIAGATSSTLDETAGGLYTVVVTDAGGCTDTSSGYTMAGGTGINGLTAAQGIKVYPNPAAAEVHIDAPQQVNISILGIDGRTVIEQKNATDVDISSLPDGMYMILVYDQSGLLLKTAKFAKAE